MLLKYITKFIRPLGLFVIFLIALWSIFGSLFLREGKNDGLVHTFLDYSSSFDDRFYDYRMREQIDRTYKSKDVVLLEIDDVSLQKIGMWPIPRSLHAKMINNLKSFGAKVLALDILYPEKAPVCGVVSQDDELAKAFSNFTSDGGAAFISYAYTDNETNALPETPDALLIEVVSTTRTHSKLGHNYFIDGYTFPIQDFLDAGAGVSNISSLADSDGVFRHYPVIIRVNDDYFPSLALSAFRAFKPEEKVVVNPLPDETGELLINEKALAQLNSRGEFKIRYVNTDAFNRMSLHKVLDAKPDDQKMKQFFEGKIVFVGSSATGAHDLRNTPIDPKLPGVYSHMNVTRMLLDQYFLKPVNDSIQYSLIILFVGMLMFLSAQYFGNAFLDLLIIAVVMGSSYYLDHIYFLPEGYELKLFFCYFCFIASYSWNTFLKFYEASREKKQIKGTFARYVAPTIVDEMLKDPEKLQVGGFKRDITCLFSDVRDFTSISEGLSATELAHSLNMYMGQMTDIVFDNKGTLDKYIGDAIVAIWGAPLEIGNHAQYAVESAIKMMEAMPAINAEFKRLGRPEFRVGVGLNSGDCNVGNMGSARIFSYTALGDNMNLGARLEGLCKYYGTQILISEYTLARIDQTNMKIRPIDKVIVKGKTLPVAIFEVLHGAHPMAADIEAFGFYNTGFQLFQKRNFAPALNIFEQILLAHDQDIPTKRMRDLCKKYVEHPEMADDDFDVTKMTEK